VTVRWVDVRVELRHDAGRIGPRSGPWIRRPQISNIYGSPDPRALCCVQTRRGEVVGWGLISESSSITVRLLSFGPERPSEDWLDQRISSAAAARERLGLAEENTTGYRLINSEGDGIPGLVVDRYDHDFVVQITTAPIAAREDAVVDRLLAIGAHRVHVIRPDSAAAREGFSAGVRHTASVEALQFQEHGISFAVAPPPGQKTGAYFDQRSNRRTIAELARRSGGPLLDVGCHVGGFSLHAAKLGVPAVGLDQSAVALNWARRNAAANGSGSIAWVQADMFAPWNAAELEGPFGTIVLDPPKLTMRRSDTDRAIVALTRMSEQAAARVLPGGFLVLCSCSHLLGREPLEAIAATFPGFWRRTMSLEAGPDHPVWPCHREGEYLRVLVFQAPA